LVDKCFIIVAVLRFLQKFWFFIVSIFSANYSDSKSYTIFESVSRIAYYCGAHVSGITFEFHG